MASVIRLIRPAWGSPLRRFLLMIPAIPGIFLIWFLPPDACPAAPYSSAPAALDLLRNLTVAFPQAVRAFEMPRSTLAGRASLKPARVAR